MQARHIHIATYFLMLATMGWSSYAGYFAVFAVVTTVCFFLMFFKYSFYLTPLVISGSVLFPIVVGISSSFFYPHPLWITVVVTAQTFNLITRFIFFKQLSYVRFPWLEGLLAIIGTTALIIGGILQQWNIWQWISPSIVCIIGIMNALGMITTHKTYSPAAKKYGVTIGEKAPEFELTDQNGELVRLSDFQDKQHSLLIFVKGDWCPYCHMTLRTYHRNRHRFAEKNIMIMAIGPDPQGVNQKMVENLGLDYKVLSDEKFTVVKKYGIQLPDFHPPGSTFHEEGTPLPASFLIDKKGVLRYASRPENPGEFLNPDTIFPIIEKLA